MSFSKIPLLSFLTLALSAPACFGQSEGPPGAALDLSDQTWLARSRQIINDSAATEVPAWLLQKEKVKALQPQAATIYRQSAPLIGQAITGKAVQAPDPLEPPTNKLPEDGRVTIFVSLSMPEDTLRDVVREACAHPDQAVLVFRGVEKDQSIDHLITVMASLLPQDPEHAPRIEIDPNQFKRLNVEVVPYISYVKNGHEYRARGVYGVDWIIRKSGSGADPSQDYGRYGAIYDIKEPDIVEEMRRRWAQLDKEKIKQQMMNNFWTDKARDMPSYLPDAVKTQVFEFDPTVVLTADIPNPAGGYLARAGDRINPAQHVPLKGRYIFFNGSKPSHIEVARKLGREALRAGHSPMYITSVVDPEKGWDDFRRIENALDSPVNVLDSALAQRFKIERLPAMLYYENGHAWIKEYSPVEFLSNKGVK